MLKHATLGFFVLAACADGPEAPAGASGGKADSSPVASFYTMTWQGKVISPYRNNQGSITNQVMYTIGQLNGNRALGRLDKLEITDMQSTAVDGNYEITYTAKMPVAWAQRAVTSYELILPMNVTKSGLERFVASYGHACVEPGAHDISVNNLWYYYRPEACELEAADIMKVSATVEPSPSQTHGKYPEYHKVWEDNRLEVVALFGKYKDGATSNDDPGINAYNEFFSTMMYGLRAFGTVTVNPPISSEPGVANPELELIATNAEGRVVRVVLMLTDNIRVGLEEPGFRAKYEAASTRADLIGYNGHAGLGANMRALSRAGKWVRDQYLIMFENGCDTYAYIDGELARAHAEVNAPNDPNGTLFLDEIVNAMPAPANSADDAMAAIVDGLMAYGQPMTYDEMLSRVDRYQVVLVTGEEDNTFQP